MRLNFAIEATCLTDRSTGGIARYCAHLLAELDALAAETQEGFRLTQLYQGSRWRRRRHLLRGRALSRQLWHRDAWPLWRPYALVHSTGFRLPPWKVPKVVTSYDVYAALGVTYVGAARDRQVQIYADFARRADRIIFVSEHSRQDFLRFFRFDPAHTRVIHLGVDAEFHPRPPPSLESLRARLGVDAPYLLYVGNNHPHKNLPRLLDAYARSSARHDFLLLLAGPLLDSTVPVRERIEQLALESRVRVVGPLDAADLPALYAGASAVLLPSLYEGFGLPILEGMASGVPVLTSVTASCPEVAAGHAVLVDPLSADDIARGIDAALRRTDVQLDAARSYAAGMTWRRTAEQTLEVYRDLC